MVPELSDYFRWYKRWTMCPHLEEGKSVQKYFKPCILSNSLQGATALVLVPSMANWPSVTTFP